jgi:hypothetical protein
MPNQVTLTFAGETKDLESGFDRVGDSSKRMTDKVGESAQGFDRAGEAADGAEGKAQGFSDTLTGVADIGAGTGQIMKGNLFEGFVTAGQGAADLAGGMAEFLIPALKASKVGTLAKAAADKVAAGASRVWAAAQWVMNSALFASPITWIVVLIVGLIAVIVLIARKTDWFSQAWRASWGWIKRAAENTWDYLKKIPGWIGSAFSRVTNLIAAPFRAAFNFVADAWNNTIGRLSWSVPGWVPFIGGNSISVPNLPHFHAGGTVPGVVGTSTMAVLQAGEKIGSVASGDDRVVPIGSDGSRLGDALMDLIKDAAQRAGGKASLLGIRVA